MSGRPLRGSRATRLVSKKENGKKKNYKEESGTSSSDEDKNDSLLTQKARVTRGEKKKAGKRQKTVESEEDSEYSASEDRQKSPVLVSSRENTRKHGRKRIIVSSDDSGSEQGSDEEQDSEKSDESDGGSRAERRKTTKKKLRKRKKYPSKTGRRDIKRIIKDEDLDEQTREAEKEERERLQRLKEKEKDEADDEVVESSPEKKPSLTVILQKNPLVEISPHFSKNLRPHQVEGVRFIWNNLVESVERATNGDGAGCILAHCMGLGKTLQTIACVHAILKSKHLKFDRVLVVAPLNTVRNWIAEFVQWCEDGDELNLYNFAEPKTNKARVNMLKEWKQTGGALVLGYDMYRIMTTRIKYSQWQKTVQETLVDPGPDIVVCDEGHMLKNSETHISKQINKVRTKRRLVLTGTPLQNNLIEYHCMVDFVKPGLLGSLKEFRNRFVNPILNGQHVDSTDHDVKIMKKRSHVLHQMLEGFVQRKDYTALKPYLSSKFEYVLKVRLTPLQIKLYRHYLDTMTNRGANDSVVNNYGKGASLFADYQNLMRVWTHPKSLLLHTVRKEQNLARMEIRQFIEDDEESEEYEETSTDEDYDEKKINGKAGNEKNLSPEPENGVLENADPEGSGPKRSTRSSKKNSGLDSTDSEASASKRTTRSRRKVVIKNSSSEGDESESDEESSSDESEKEDAEKLPDRRTRSRVAAEGRRYRLRCEESGGEEKEDSDVASEKETIDWYTDILPEDKSSLETYQNSLKITLLFEILKLAGEKDEKVLVFSQSLISLDLIEEMLNFAPPPNRFSENREEKSDEPGKTRWYKNIDYFRMDGATQGHHRQRWINAFNDEDDPRSRLFLISTRAGSLGVNLIGANRVVIFDASWNPSHDTQSMFRVYRLGQTKECYIYRFIAEGTMEEKIYQRQVNKQSLAFRVVDEQQINRHFTASSLAEMYTFNPTTPDVSKPEPTPIVPKDEILAEILSDPRTRHMVASYHEHDSLLDHQVDQELTEEERKAAWEEYEIVKRGGYVPNPANQGYVRKPVNQNAPPFPNPFPSKKKTYYISTDNMNAFSEMGALLGRLSKMVANAYFHYQACEVKSVPSIEKHLKETPLYSTASYATVKAIAVEVYYRLKAQKEEKYKQYLDLKSQFQELQSQYITLGMKKNLFTDLSRTDVFEQQASTSGSGSNVASAGISVPSRAEVLMQMSSNYNAQSNKDKDSDQPNALATVTKISEVIEIDDDDDMADPNETTVK